MISGVFFRGLLGMPFGRLVLFGLHRMQVYLWVCSMTEPQTSRCTKVSFLPFSFPSKPSNSPLPPLLHPKPTPNRDLASTKNVTPAQLTLAWVLSQGDDFFTIPGTKSQRYLLENLGGLDVKLTEDEIERIESVIKKIEVVGARYVLLFRVKWCSYGWLGFYRKPDTGLDDAF